MDLMYPMRSANSSSVRLSHRCMLIMLSPGPILATFEALILVGLPAMSCRMICFESFLTMVPVWLVVPFFMVTVTQLLAMTAAGLMMDSAMSAFLRCPSLLRSGPLMRSPALMLWHAAQPTLLMILAPLLALPLCLLT